MLWGSTCSALKQRLAMKTKYEGLRLGIVRCVQNEVDLVFEVVLRLLYRLLGLGIRV